MYFQESEVRALLGEVAKRFPGAEVFFDTIPYYLSHKTLRGFKVTKRYTAPPMPWGIAIDEIPAFLRSIPGLEPITVQTYADPFPRRTPLYALLSQFPSIRRTLAGGLVHARFTADAHALAVRSK
jgi:hypothetical protein